MPYSLAFFPIVTLALFRHQGNFWEWIRNILHERRRSNAIICPLMIQEPMRFSTPLVFCEIPRTRVIYMARTGKGCCRKGHCCPRRALGHAAQEEATPSIPPRIRRPRGAWIASLK